jgi:hypothetical protein
MLAFGRMNTHLPQFIAGKYNITVSGSEDKPASDIHSPSLSVIKNRILSVGDANVISTECLLGTKQCICLHRCSMLSDGIASILATSLCQASNVECISLHHCNVNENALSRIKYYIPKELKANFKEKNTYGKNTKMRKIASSTSSSSSLCNNDKLQILDLSFNDFDRNAVKVISKIVTQAPHLEMLILDGNQFANIDMRCLSTCIRKHPRLTTLSFNNCGLTDDCVEHIVKAIKGNRNITYIDISQNEITPLGFQLLLNAIAQNSCRHLQHIDISYNNLVSMSSIDEEEEEETSISLLATEIARGKLPFLKELLLKQVGATQSALRKLLIALSIPLPPVDNHDNNGNNNEDYIDNSKSEGHKTPMEYLALEVLDISGNELFPYPPKKRKKGIKGVLSGGMSFSKKDLNTYIDKLSKTTEQIATNPTLNDGFNRLSNKMKSMASVLESSTEAGLKYLTGESDDFDGHIDATDKNGRIIGIPHKGNRKTKKYLYSSAFKGRKGSKKTKGGRRSRLSERKMKMKGRTASVPSDGKGEESMLSEDDRLIACADKNAGGDDNNLPTKKSKPTRKNKRTRKPPSSAASTSASQKSKKRLSLSNNTKTIHAVFDMIKHLASSLKYLGLSQTGINDSICKELNKYIQKETNTSSINNESHRDVALGTQEGTSNIVSNSLANNSNREEDRHVSGSVDMDVNALSSTASDKHESTSTNTSLSQIPRSPTSLHTTLLDLNAQETIDHTHTVETSSRISSFSQSTAVTVTDEQAKNTGNVLEVLLSINQISVKMVRQTIASLRDLQRSTKSWT